jgi:hypothetical protein
MKSLCLQFQPDRAPKISVGHLSASMLRIALAEKGTREFTVRRNRSETYIDYLFVGPAVGALWSAVRVRAFDHRLLGASLRQACITTAEGSRGWKNYLLLQHFDPTQTLDKLRVPNHNIATGNPRVSASQIRSSLFARLAAER